jgi:(R,R)-butanediol dehydrogenase/meso-butanediol dehydrogenase/diacetyl reductase
VKCARWYGPKVVRVEEVPLPVAKDDEAVVRVLWTGLCGSDLEEYLHGPVVANPPVVLGHEIVGVVEVSARDGSGPSQGTHVVVDVVTGVVAATGASGTRKDCALISP